MIACLRESSFEETPFGQICELYHPLNLDLNSPTVKAKILRKATREEFISYWMTNDPIRFIECKKEIGDPPETSCYWEISID